MWYIAVTPEWVKTQAKDDLLLFSNTVCVTQVYATMPSLHTHRKDLLHANMYNVKYIHINTGGICPFRYIFTKFTKLKSSIISLEVRLVAWWLSFALSRARWFVPVCKKLCVIMLLVRDFVHRSCKIVMIIKVYSLSQEIIFAKTVDFMPNMRCTQCLCPLALTDFCSLAAHSTELPLWYNWNRARTTPASSRQQASSAFRLGTCKYVNVCTYEQCTTHDY